MILWPLSNEHKQRLVDAFVLKFGNTHNLELINDANVGYLAYSEGIKNKTKTVINISDPAILSLLIEQYLSAFVEHEYLHVYGVGTPRIASLNPPEITPDHLWQVVQNTLTEQLLDMVKCTNVILQQEMARDYVEFECKKFEYYFSKYGAGMIQVTKTMTYGYLDALCEHLKVDYKTQKDHLNISDLAILQSTKELISELITSRPDNLNVDLFDLSVSLDQKIRHQSKLI